MRHDGLARTVVPVGVARVAAPAVRRAAPATVGPGGAVVSVAVLPRARPVRRARASRLATAVRRAALRTPVLVHRTAIVAADRVAPAPTAAAAPSTDGVAVRGTDGVAVPGTDGAPRRLPVPGTDGVAVPGVAVPAPGTVAASRTVAVPGTAAVGARATVVSPGTVAGPRTTVATAVPAATGAAGPSRPVPSPTPCAGRASPARTRRTRGTGVAEEPSATRRSYAGRVTVARSLVLFAVAAVAEIGGAWLMAGGAGAPGRGLDRSRSHRARDLRLRRDAAAGRQLRPGPGRVRRDLRRRWSGACSSTGSAPTATTSPAR